MVRVVIAAMGVGVLLVVTQGWVSADEPEPPRDEARELVIRGNEADRSGDHAQALALYEEAYRKSRRPIIRYAIGMTLHGLGREIEAIEALEDFLAEAGDPDHERRQVAKDTVAAIDRGLGRVLVSTDVVGATITIDGTARASTPQQRLLRVAPGAHEITVTKEGHDSFSTRIEVAADQLQRIEASLPIPPPAPAADPTPPSWLRRHRGSAIAAGAAAVLSIAGTGVGIWTWRRYADLSPTCAGSSQGCPESDIDSLERQELATNVLFAAAGVAAATAVVLYLLVERDPKPTRDIAVVPTIGGASVLVRF